MAFTKSSFQQIGGGGKAGDAPQLFSYASADAKTAIDAAGDFIFVHASTGGTRTYSIAPVVSNAAGVVDIGDGTAISATDSD